ncbi:MAG: hypothetical protein L0216_06610 [Planctomycetales bacterium]|nr:hypothetical protein [Planctomycetales bacterium]
MTRPARPWLAALAGLDLLLAPLVLLAGWALRPDRWQFVGPVPAGFEPRWLWLGPLGFATLAAATLAFAISVLVRPRFATALAIAVTVACVGAGACSQIGTLLAFRSVTAAIPGFRPPWLGLPCIAPLFLIALHSLAALWARRGTAQEDVP